MTDITIMQILEMTLKLVLAIILGGVIGYEREVHGRPAGLRTHILVCIGATIFTIVSIAFAAEGADPARIAAQVVTGIGFLGAGTIIRQGNIVKGLTTAASLWAVAAIGVAIGAGGTLFFLAIIGTAVVYATLGIITRIEHRLMASRRPRELIVTARGPRRRICDIIEAVLSKDTEVTNTRIEPTEQTDILIYRLRVRISPEVETGAIAETVNRIEGVLGIEWE